MSASPPADDERHYATVGVFERVADVYDRAGFEFFSPFGQALVEAAEIGPGERVLDAACGAGAVLLPAARAVGEDGEAVGVDLAENMVTRAREAVAGQPQASAQQGDGMAPGFPPESFDAVMCGFAVFILPDPDAALRAWRELLRPGGRVAISVWAAGGDERWQWERDLRRSLMPELPPRLLMEFGRVMSLFDTPEKTFAALEGAGYTDLSATPHTIERRFADEDAYWAWNFSHGGRLMLDALSEETFARHRADVSRELAARAEPGGGWTRRFSALLAVGHRPT